MEGITFGQICPFVRYCRVIDAEMKQFAQPICAYDSRLFYCVEGRGEMDAGGRRIAVSPGTVLLFGPGVPYQYHPDEEHPMRFLGLNFDYTREHSHLCVPIPPDPVEDFQPPRITQRVRFTDLSLLNEPVVLREMEAVYPKLAELDREFRQKRKFYEMRCSGLLLSVLATLVLYQDCGGEQAVPDQVAQMIDYIGVHFQEPLSNQDIGSAFGYHPNYINRLFLRYTGMSLHRYLLHRRLQHAVHLLLDTDLPIAEVCYQSGFRDLTHFSKYFKKSMGRCPTSFR